MPWRFYTTAGEEKQGPGGIVISPDPPPATGVLWLDTDQPPSITPGTLLDVQKIMGASAAYKTITSGQRITTNAAGTIDLALNYTPPVDAWWEILLFVGTVQKTDAAYHYCQMQCVIAPNDVDGLQTHTMTKTQHATVQQFEPYNMNALWKLAAGTPYQAYATAGFSGGTWQYQQAQNHLLMVSKAWAR